VSEDLTGQRLGRYRIDGVIGRGGMSVLYRATDMRLGRQVALKIIGEQLAADPEFRERFVDEARNTSAVDHAHVVPLYDFDEVDGRLYIAMRYVEGSDLASLIKAGPLGAQRTLTLLGQVAEALDALHGRGLVHLDVKPANVLVTHKESIGSEHVYLADFGLTRRGATGHRTRGGDFLGSPTYAAPEHLRGEPVDARTDQYSLCCVLFACLTGRPPFLGTVPQVIAGHLGAAPPAVTPFALLPSAIDAVVRRGMSKDPARRYGSCRELMSAARAALAAPMPPRRPAAGAGSATLAAGPPQGYRPGPSQHPGPPQHPMRIRDPLPMQSAAFATATRGSAGWLVPVLIGALVIGVIVFVLILALSNRGAGTGPSTPSTTSPSINVPYSSGDRLPTRVPTVTR
jgi:serine/threonine protein kinase, bacterial